jgi:hypothetical protein
VNLEKDTASHPSLAMHRASTTLAATMIFIAAMLVAAVAFAQTTVLVQVRGPNGTAAEAVVTLTPQGGGAPHSCRTSSGACRISGVPEGTYVVTAEPISGGRAPIPRPVPVPPGTEVTVHVSLR